MYVHVLLYMNNSCLECTGSEPVHFVLGGKCHKIGWFVIWVGNDIQQRIIFHSCFQFLEYFFFNFHSQYERRGKTRFLGTITTANRKTKPKLILYRNAVHEIANFSTLINIFWLLFPTLTPKWKAMLGHRGTAGVKMYGVKILTLHSPPPWHCVYTSCVLQRRGDPLLWRTEIPHARETSHRSWKSSPRQFA